MERGGADVLRSRVLRGAATLACLSAVVGAGCKSGNGNLSDIGSGSSGSGSSSGGSSSGGSSGSSSGGIDASQPETGGNDGGADAAMDATADTSTHPEGGNFDSSVFGDVTIGPTDDASQDVTAPTDAPLHGNGNVCAQQLGWWMAGATLDTSVVSASAAAALNPLLSVQNPVTLAESFLDAGPSDAGPSWIFISGTETNGVSQQYFPFAFPATPAALVQAPGSIPVFTATSPSGQPSTGWIRLLDSTQAEVWIAITNISATLTAGDSFCQSLSSGKVDAIIPTSAGTTTMVLTGGTTSVAAVFGASTSTSPPGWNIRLTFTGQKVQVTFK